MITADELVNADDVTSKVTSFEKTACLVQRRHPKGMNWAIYLDDDTSPVAVAHANLHISVKRYLALVDRAV
jgi:predicted GNAT family acetyltransferase